MNENREPLRDKYQTANRIKRLVKDYSKDLEAVNMVSQGKKVPLCDLPIIEFFVYVKNIPYRRDPSPLEIVSRPYYILKHQNLGMDCKKKAVLIGSYCQYNRIPYRFIGSSKRRDKKVHHIFPQVIIDGRNGWQNFDATYDYYHPFEKKFLTYAEVL
jgi:hypothetical protein